MIDNSIRFFIHYLIHLNYVTLVIFCYPDYIISWKSEGIYPEETRIADVALVIKEN